MGTGQYYCYEIEGNYFLFNARWPVSGSVVAESAN
jgi:hypothetical protein